MKTYSFYSRQVQRGFSLVEVAIAMGIITFSLVSVLGLLPIGLSSFRDATESTIESQIISQITAEASLTPFHALPDYASGSPYFFDEEGSPTRTEAESTYRAEISLKTPNYPGKPVTINGDLANLQVKITSRRNQSTSKRLHNLFIARSDAQQSGS